MPIDLAETGKQNTKYNLKIEYDMKGQEFKFKGMALNGIAMLILLLLATIGSVVLFVYGVNDNPDKEANSAVYLWCTTIGLALFIVAIICYRGLMMVEPNEARVMMFFGKYVGTFTGVGYYWVNPFISTKKLSLRARNLDVDPIKVNDKVGNPVMIGLVLVWKLKDTYKAMFDIDAQTMAETKSNGEKSVSSVMNAFEKFVKIQSDAALRQVAGEYAYDDDDTNSHELTLRGGSEEINKVLEAKLDERLEMAGIEIVEARINYLAYAPEIAAVMLRRQQAAAVITAREKIVEGAVTMVKLALDRLASDDVVELDEEKKAAMVSNLLVVLCADENPQPVLNTGTLNH